jgi:hexosaminidase
MKKPTDLPVGEKCRKMKKILILPLVLLLLAGCNKSKPTHERPDIIPLPFQTLMGDGNFTINGKTKILVSSSSEEVKGVAEIFSEQIAAVSGFSNMISDAEASQPKNSILLNIDQSLQSELGKEGYKLSVTSSRILITAPEPAGLFYGIQTIYQLLPPEIFGDTLNSTGKDLKLKVPCLEISDKPSFSWRGMHLDVSRHFFPKEFILKYIDLIAMHKMNIFHWHLTDDNGWRIEIEKYPLLTEVSAWRADRQGKTWNESKPQRPGEPATYGGFYTKEDIREVVAYAKERFITIVPEIEMPGHTSEVFAAYPQFSCSGEKIPVQTGSYWPNTDIFCAGNDGTFRFLEDIIDEVAELFPGEYIHIGGDEADKTAWKACPKCQARIKQEGLAGVDELQSYFIKRISKHIASKGKKMIGWDEILEGGLAPDATVMSWRGFEGGIEAARQGHDVVMCPVSHCYFDYYQADPEFQPLAIGGLTTVRKVYSFRPVPSELMGEPRLKILGGQGNIWTEYISTPSHAEYMALPRMTALAEVLWSQEKDLRWGDFRNRLQSQFLRFKNMDANYFEGSGKVEPMAMFDVEDKPYAIKLQTEASGTEIYYTLSGKIPDNKSFVYKNPVKIENDVILKAIAYKDGNKLEKVSEYNILYHRALGKKIQYVEGYSERYPANGSQALVDGIKGSLDYNDGHWQGFNGRNADVIIDLGDEFAFKSISVTFLLDQKKWIFIPDTVNFYFSLDGNNYQKVASVDHAIPLNNNIALTNDFTAKLNKPIKIRYIRMEAVNIGICPDWHPGKGQKAWLFVDEIVVK